MANTRKVEKVAEQRRISQVGDFKERVGGLLELPSGLTIRWRNPGGLRAFLTSGKVPNVLLNVVERGMKGGVGSEEEMAADVMRQLQDNPEMLAEMTAFYDHVARRCFVEPKLYPVPDEEMAEAWNKAHPDEPVEDPEELRYDDRLYVDEVPDEDKQYLFQCLSGGVKDLETFRQQHEISMDSLAKVSGAVSGPLNDSGAN
jgi:hypothetical protein